MQNDDAWANALQEFESSARVPGLWARCFAEAGGDEGKAKAAYITARVAQDAPSPSARYYCPNCGASCGQNDEKCEKCGAIFGFGWSPRASPEAKSKPPQHSQSPRPPLKTEPAAETKGGSLWRWVIGLPIAAFILVVILGTCAGNTPEGKAKAQARAAIELCWQNQGKKSLAPGEQRFIAGACEMLEQDFQKQFGHKP